jgi:GNAT superfamily N-acetyltransferase
MMAAMELRKVEFGSSLAAPLLAGLSDEYQTRYGSIDEMTRAGAGEFVAPTGLFVVLVDVGSGGGPVTAAGGGFRRHTDDACEVKRMWTRPDYRRQGLGRMVLAALEAEAAAVGYGRVVLETGPRQHEAEAMYHSLGYRRIPAYGHYQEALAFEKALVSVGR